VGQAPAHPSRPQRGRRTAAGVALLGLVLLATVTPAQARRPPIEGHVTAGYTVVALDPDGHTRSVRARGRFSLVPPARTVTLHVLDPKGLYVGPVVVAARARQAVVRVRAGARLGRLNVKDGWVRAGRRIPARRLGRGPRARARAGVPIGAGVLGRVRGRPSGPVGPGHDRDRDGIPGRYDVDDDGDLVLDTRERGTARGRHRGLAAVGGLAACPEPLCSGTAAVEVSGEELDLALVIAIVAAALAAASLGWQAGAALRRRRGGVEVEARLGLPVYAQGAGRWAVFIELFNRTDHPVRWVSAALEMRDGRIFYLMEHPPGGELPAVIQPHDSHHTWVDCHELERQGLALDAAVVAAAKLATGETIRSPARRLASRRSRFFG
jgi:hypothetical protein